MENASADDRFAGWRVNGVLLDFVVRSVRGYNDGYFIIRIAFDTGSTGSYTYKGWGLDAIVDIPQHILQARFVNMKPAKRQFNFLRRHKAIYAFRALLEDNTTVAISIEKTEERDHASY